MTIYIDIVIIENLIMNYIILCATGIVSKNKIRHLRLIMASLLGAIYSVVAYMKILEIYSNIVLKILLSVIIVYIAYNPQTVKKLWKTLVMFYLVSFVFGGVAFSLIYIIKPQDIIMKNGLFLGTYPLKTIILGAIVAFAIIIIAVKIIRKKFTTKDMICDIEIMLNNKKINTKALIDTGNMLKEPITNTPVVVVEKILLYECIPKEILNNINQIIGGDLEKIPQQIQSQYISKLKLIPFSSLGKQNGMLLGIKADEIEVEKEEDKKITKNVIIGIYDKSLTKRGEYCALVGLDLI